LVTLESPTSDDLAALSSTATSVGIATAPVTPETYVAVAGQVLAALYGNAVGVATAYGIPLTLFDRFTDYSPFYGGDQIEYETSGGEAVCTGGFAVVALVGNRAGDDFMLSAGHCGDAAAWYLTGCQECSGDGTDMGWTSTIYFEDPARDDFQAILTQPIGASSAAGYVYGTGYTYYVEGVDNVGYGQPFTFDGSVTGEVRGATAGYSGLCEWFDKHTVEDCNLIEGNRYFNYLPVRR
jgi:hypothetical protein